MRRLASGILSEISSRFGIEWLDEFSFYIERIGFSRFR
jgi:hypothetical protein